MARVPSLVAALALLACLGTTGVHAQAVNTDRVRDVGLGRLGDFEPGLTLGARVDQNLRFRDDGLLRTELYALASTRVNALSPVCVCGTCVDWVLGLYGSLPGAGRWAGQETYTAVANPELGVFVVTQLALGEVIGRYSYSASVNDDCLGGQDSGACDKASDLLVDAARTRVADFAHYLVASRVHRGSVHYRLDYGVLFFQVDAGLDRRLRREGAAERIEEGWIRRLGFGMGLGINTLALTWDVAAAWADRSLFLDDDQRESFAGGPDGGRADSTTHTFALQLYKRHWTYYVGYILAQRGSPTQALTAGIDYSF